MEEPKESPKPKRSKRKPAMEPLGWDEIVSQPGMGGYLSFLNGPVPLPHLATGGVASAGGVAGAGVDSAAVSPVETTAGVDLATEPVTRRGDEAATGAPSAIAVVPSTVHDTTTGVDPVPGLPKGGGGEPATGIYMSAVVDSAAEVIRVDTTAGVDSGTVATIPPAPRVRIRRCFGAQDGHSLGEEVLYQALWKAATPEEQGDARTIVIGWRGMSQICRMTPKNCKINTQRLIRKLALEILSPYNTPESIGTTYRVHSAESIVRRRRAAGLEWVIRSRGVEFVDPATGAVMPMCAVTC